MLTSETTVDVPEIPREANSEHRSSQEFEKTFASVVEVPTEILREIFDESALWCTPARKRML